MNSNIQVNTSFIKDKTTLQYLEEVCEVLFNQNELLNTKLRFDHNKITIESKYNNSFTSISQLKKFLQDDVYFSTYQPIYGKTIPDTILIQLDDIHKYYTQKNKKKIFLYFIDLVSKILIIIAQSNKNANHSVDCFKLLLYAFYFIFV